jgi:prevent-host-death family protein
MLSLLSLISYPAAALFATIVEQPRRRGKAHPRLGGLHDKLGQFRLRNAMDRVGVFEAKKRFAVLLDRVEQGEKIVITRCGKPVAVLVPAAPGSDRTKVKRAIAGLLEASRGLSLGGLAIKELIEEGRS